MLQKILSALVLLSTLLFSNITFSQSHSILLSKTHATGSIRVIVGFKTASQPNKGPASAPNASTQQRMIADAQSTLKTQLSGHHVDHIKAFETIPYMAMEVDAAALEILSNDPQVLTIVEDIASPPTLGESIPFINGHNALSRGYDGSGTTIAILDSGIRKTHEFLDSGKVVSEACYSSTFLPDSATTLCPNGQESQIGAGAGINCDLSINGCSHGTHVAGIAAGTLGASGNGVAPGANIISIQVFSQFSDPDDCDAAPCTRAYTSDQILGFERVYALRNTYNIAAINMSIGSGEHSSFCDTDARKAIIDQLRAVGIATVLSSGNDSFDGAVGAPACISSAITVGATLNNTDIIWSDSNHASMIDLMAPGESIRSSTASSDSSYGSWNGTSMAAPHIAGAFAVMRSKNNAWSVDEIETLLKSSGSDVTRVGISRPRINLLAALMDDDYEANNKLTTAYDLSHKEKTWLNTIDGLGIQSNVDWYKIHVTPGADSLAISLTFTHNDGDIDLALYDSSEQLIDRSISTSDNESIELPSPPSGDYYLKIYYDDDGNTYDLWWDDVNEDNIAGDANGDGMVNIADVIFTINQVLSSAAPTLQTDCNNSSSLDISDVICTINIVLSQ